MDAITKRFMLADMESVKQQQKDSEFIRIFEQVSSTTGFGTLLLSNIKGG